MAYVNPIDQQQQQNGVPATPGMNQAPQTSSTGGGGNTVSTSPQGVAASPSTTTTPQVQDLKAYLAANAPQAVQMGQNIASGLNQQVNQVTGDVNAAQQSFQQGVQAQNTAPNQTLVEQAASNPSEFVKNPQNVKDFLAQKNATYTGPATFESTPQYSTLNQKVQNAVSAAPNINAPGGVQQLVTGQETNPTIGMENLDTLLLQGNPAAMAPIQSALPKFANLSGYLSNAATQGNAAVNAAIANNRAAQAGVQNRFLTGANAVVPAWEKALANEVSSAQGKQNEYNQQVNDYVKYLNTNQPFAVALKNSGLESTLGLTPAFQAAPNPITGAPDIAKVATPQDYEVEAALEKLLGSDLGHTPINQTTANQAGTFTRPGSVPEQTGIDSILGQITQAEGQKMKQAIENAGLSNLIGPVDYSNNQLLSRLIAQGASNLVPDKSAYEALLNEATNLYPNYVNQGTIKLPGGNFKYPELTVSPTVPKPPTPPTTNTGTGNTGTTTPTAQPPSNPITPDVMYVYNHLANLEGNQILESIQDNGVITPQALATLSPDQLNALMNSI